MTSPRRKLRDEMIESICEEYAGAYHPENLGHISLRAKLYKLAEVSPDYDKAVDKTVDALKTWVTFEEDCIKKDGPYVSQNIPNLIKKAREALAAYEKASGK